MYHFIVVIIDSQTKILYYNLITVLFDGFSF